MLFINDAAASGEFLKSQKQQTLKVVSYRYTRTDISSSERKRSPVTLNSGLHSRDVQSNTTTNHTHWMTNRVRKDKDEKHGGL